MDKIEDVQIRVCTPVEYFVYLLFKCFLLWLGQIILARPIQMDQFQIIIIIIVIIILKGTGCANTGTRSLVVTFAHHVSLRMNTHQLAHICYSESTGTANHLVTIVLSRSAHGIARRAP